MSIPTSTVSVVMATYNGEKYIKEQLDSIIAQTYPIYELIIQDDCSTDSTRAILTFVQDETIWQNEMAYDIKFGIFAHLRGGVTKVEEPLNWHRLLPASVSHRQNYGTGKGSKMAPYLSGLKNFRSIQRKELFVRYYQMIHAESKGKNELIHTLSGLMMQRGILAMLRLQFLCLRHRQTIYPGNVGHNVAGVLRGFFFPFIHSFQCHFYDSNA